jgi:hypothetical protein
MSRVPTSSVNFRPLRSVRAYRRTDEENPRASTPNLVVVSIRNDCLCSALPWPAGLLNSGENCDPRRDPDDFVTLLL